MLNSCFLSVILKVVANLIQQSHPSPEVTVVKELFLKDITQLCNGNKENRRCSLCKIYSIEFILLFYHKTLISKN